jgi:hypothetical protein
VVLAAVLALSASALSGLGRRPTSSPAPALADVLPADQPAQTVRPGHWSVVVDGWHIELDTVAGQRFPQIESPSVLPSLLSPYDQVIARYAEAAGLDWRFVAAVIYEESRFDSASISDAGAYGLMQVMPAAAREVGEGSFHEPEENIRTGVRYLQRLQRDYQSARDLDRQALMLAAYNMGPGHLEDAQKLARRFGYDPFRWDGAMDVMVSLLEEPAVYPQVTNGFARGRAVVAYVDRVLRRFATYRRSLPAQPFPAIRTATGSP